MAINLKMPDIKLPGKNRSEKKIKKGKIPKKKHINILIRKKKSFSLKKSLPIIVLICVIFLVFCKFMVIDRVTSVVKETNRVSSMQEELADINAQINDMKELDDIYAHYTTSGMTEEELSRVDRVSAMKLIDKSFLHGDIARTWNLTGNVMTLQVTGTSLKGLNQLASELESNPIVESCVISSADKRTDANGNVSVTFTIYLQQPEEDE